ncbi:Xaa-Pro aminopeptidase [Mycolicibacterium phlei]|jgi:Xaa-Pro dipeptidase|uniref:Peptidase M24 n=1 Tax=Mycolicibacterium phlei DSM 43239 = CCUG 21000 TaxID=1226750 RepID=A0A5N5V2W0_MYCPH|nr:M24 family metallopeptidase [Mycolicibacterium phlei]VEG10693.1 Xaa-Pro aminopeptidase [Mycobacteroides chelonae]AMO62592.1 putative peptidase [Mycolicibacterium phlei]EID11580.1 Xaa-Pro aminopeptidase [Mycolicibacterium phlei RIVM601174]KAB7756234.1 peptidase M24 [Mycolicibacterium phlei DSM 43239 = CCUG 21000]KXW61492.1 peptidase M24 [Mycolicibacterium phlei DSM 43239 = CCUG 21000]
MALEILPDAADLRRGRRERALAQMAEHDIDILVLGRQANVRYVTGAPQLWVAGTRPFGPICEVIRSTGEIHLNSTWDEGIPEEIPHDHLYGLAWNPMTLVEVLKKLPGAASAKRVGTDALTPTFAQLLPLAFPNAEIVDAEPALRAARRIKTADEIAVLRGALAMAESALGAARAELAPGVTERSLTGALMEAMTAGGVSTPATQDGAWVTSRTHPWRRDSADGRVAEGDLVAFSAGVLADGYVAEVGRTWPVGEAPGAAELFERWNALRDRLIAACAPGRRVGDLLAAYEASGEPLPAMPVAHGLGLGYDEPVVTPALGGTVADETLEPGMVLAVSSYVWRQGVGAVFGRDAVHVTAGGPEVLTSSPIWNGAGVEIG